MKTTIVTTLVAALMLSACSTAKAHVDPRHLPEQPPVVQPSYPLLTADRNGRPVIVVTDDYRLTICRTDVSATGNTRMVGAKFSVIWGCKAAREDAE